MNRRGPAPAIFSLICFLGVPAVLAVDNVCDPGEAPDLVIGDMEDKGPYGVVGDIPGFAIGNTTCNLGTCQGNWDANSHGDPRLGRTCP